MLSGRSRRPALQEVTDNQDGFIPRREIPRTPPRVYKPVSTLPPKRDVIESDEEEPAKNIVVTPGSKAKGNRENFPPDFQSPSDQRKVQASCFTPSRSLARSPPRKKFDSNDPAIDVPPVSRWEIPRTPITVKHLSPTPPQSGTSKNEPTTSQSQSVSSKNCPENISQKTIQPGIGVSLPDGLVCTETDIAYIKRMKNIQEHNKLQKQLVQLDKDLRTTAEQKEQLQHTAEKVSTDLQDMVKKQKYLSTLSSVHGLQSTSDPTDSTHSTTTSLTCDEDMLATSLSHTHLTRLHQMKKLMKIQLEKTDCEIEKKVSKIFQEKQEFENKKKKITSNVQVLEKDIKNIQADKCAWKEKVKVVSETHQNMTKQLENLQSQLEHTTVHESRDQDHTHNGDITEAEKRARAEERLRRLVTRCDLYVKRHKLLKQLQQN